MSTSSAFNKGFNRIDNLNNNNQRLLNNIKMKKSIYYGFILGIMCLGLASSCSNKAKEPEVARMESTQDSLEQVETELSTKIEDLQKSMREVDKEFELKN